MTTTSLIALGGYSRSGSGRGPGVELLALDGERALASEDPAVRRLWSVDLPDPSFVLWNREGTLLHAVLETDPTRVATLRVAPDGSSAELVADLAVEGAGGCHLSFGTDPSTLLIAQYGSGSVVTVRLDEEGVPLEQIDHDHHREIADDADPHAHQVVPLPGTGLLAVPDLGLDRVMLYKQGISGSIDLAGEIGLSRGSGPRHLVADHESEQLHISCELSGMVATAVRTQEQRTRTLPPAMQGSTRRWSVRSMIPASGHEGTNALSHIELTADESALLVANRGPDTLSLLSLSEMRPQLIAETQVGAHPRHFAQLGELVLVAAQEGDRIDLLRLRVERLETVGIPIPAPSVSCLAVRP